MARLVSLFDLRPDASLLDVGGGTGAYTALFAEGCEEIVVLEPDPSKVAYGKTRRPGVRFVEGMAEHLPFREDSFDRVAAVFSMHHVADPDAVLAEMYRVMGTEGKLVIQELNPPTGRKKGRHDLHFQAPSQLERGLEAKGFRDVSQAAGVRGYLIAARK